ncbi:TetR/AcrR family transcriptional regulator [Calorimonas adulescens]|uniref:TetR/AcrR family transcriptional regulator n=1 Tax=Calorimonas adulescens TaxID=2606906 RepID=A0A5D8QDJ4_9THEO|nr:TetR/AcrR family transcriptional regulator [Calorimonas adulescens]TZE82437.1 TetR/AcrR family transcriptional regulator [Calorimonas adulescens]
MSKESKIPTKKRIIETAIELFRKNGYDKVTIKDICEKSGISKSTFYYYFDSKDSIIADFKFYSDVYVEENFNKLITSSNYVEQLWNFYEMYSKPTYEAGVEISKQIFISNLHEDHHFFAPGDIKLWETEKLLIQKAQQSGQILNTASPEKLAESLIFAMEGVVLVWCIKNGDFDLFARIKQVFETILMVKPGYF